MDKIISFLMNNFYFVIIVIGLIYSMFFRKSPMERPPSQRPPQRTPGRMPDFGGSPVFPPKSRPSGSTGEKQPVQGHSAKPVERREPRTEFGEPTQGEARDRRHVHAETPNPARSIPVYEEEASAAPVVLSRPASTQSAYAEHERTAPAAAAAVSSPNRHEDVTGDDLTRAVVWAEILGPPRARRPFRK